MPGTAAATAQRTFAHLLVNTAVANLTTNYLWWALTFWAYLETRSVLATGLVGGAYMLAVSFSSVFFGSFVDHHRKLDVMRASTTFSLVMFALAGAVFLLLLGVEALSRMMTLSGISNGFADLIAGWELGRIEFLLLMVVVYLVLGAFMDPLPMMVLTVPILIPTLENLDISLLWFGAFTVFMGELAILSPPVGVLSMVIHSIAKDPEVNLGRNIPLKDVFVAALWFLPMAIAVVLLLIFFPEISTFLPDSSSAG